MTPDKRELARRIAGRFGKEREDVHAIIAHALLEAEAELAATKAEVERLRALVEEAYAEGYRNGPFANWHASNAKKAMEEDQMSEYTWLDRPDGPGWWWIEGRSCPYEVEADKRGNLLVRTGSQSWLEPQAFTGARFQRVRLPKGDAK
jgi:peptidoglycan hydrolase-like amidase